MKECHKDHRQHIIRSDTDKHLLILYLIIRSDRLYQIRHKRIRIHTESINIHTFYCFCDSRSRWVRILVRVQLNNILLLRLLARYIRDNLTYIFFPILHRYRGPFLKYVNCFDFKFYIYQILYRIMAKL